MQPMRSFKVIYWQDLPSGYVGLACKANRDAIYDNIEVRRYFKGGHFVLGYLFLSKNKGNYKPIGKPTDTWWGLTIQEFWGKVYEKIKDMDVNDLKEWVLSQLLGAKCDSNSENQI